VNFSEGDIVVIVQHPIAEAVGRDAEVLMVVPHLFRPGGEMWYVVAEATGKKREAAHSWLRRRGWGEVRVVLEFDTAEA
jgi:hypothetical protein